MTTHNFSHVLEAAGFTPTEIAAAQATKIVADSGPVHIHEGNDSALVTYVRTATSVAALRAILNPIDAQNQGLGHGELSATTRRAAERLGGPVLRKRLSRADAQVLAGQANAAVFGTHEQLEQLEGGLTKALLPARVTAAAASSLWIKAGQVVVVGHQSDPSQPFSLMLDQLTIEPGGQLVLASPTSLNVTTINRSVSVRPRTAVFTTQDEQTPNITSVGSPGNNGQDGQNGNNGSPGGAGNNGQDGSCGKCDSQPTNGGRGGNGSSGTDGAAGTSGSDAPPLNIHVDTISGDFLIYTGGGSGGTGGKGGTGGNGGDGGPAGQTTSNCKTAASQGPGGNAANGGNGGAGGNGGNGANITIIYNTFTGNPTTQNPESKGGSAGTGGPAGTPGIGNPNGDDATGGITPNSGETGKSGTVNLIPAS